MHWNQPENFKWLWLAAGLLLAFIWFEFRKRRLLKRFGDIKTIATMNSTLDPKKRRFKQFLLLASIPLIVISLAGPEIPGKSVFVKYKGLDIVIAVDVSASMMTEDVKPNRLEKAKLELQEFVDKAESDRIGVIAFAGNAFIQSPLTLDRSSVKLFLKSLSPNLIPIPGTNLSDVIRVSKEAFSDENAENKILILLTDGEDHDSDPIKSAKEAERKGIRIYAIGIGTPKGEVIPIRDNDNKVRFKKDLYGNIVISKLDEKTLKEMTTITGGVYYRTQYGNLQVDQIYSDIRSLSGKETGSGWVLEYEPFYQYFLFLALCLLILEFCLSERIKNLSA